MEIELFQPISVLMVAGYTQTDNGWIKNLNEKDRFHAHITGRGKINLHLDKTLIDRSGKYHSAKGTIKLGYYDILRGEAKRLRKI